MKIRQLKINHMENPIGFSFDSTVFSWIPEAEKEEAVSWHLSVKDENEIIYDSGEADLDPMAVYADLTLKPKTRYTWTVQAMNGGSVLCEESAWFETGKMNEAFEGRWITCADQTEQRHPVFVKRFSRKEALKKARLYITACGLFECELNGKKITAEHLLPYCNAYDLWLQVYTFDLTDLIEGENEIRIALGNGWYRGRFGFDQSEDPAYGDTWKLLCDIELTDQNDLCTVIGSDDSWSVQRSNIIFSNIYDGEIRDDTLEPVKEEQAVYAQAEDVPLKDRLSLPVYEQENFKPVLLHTPKDEYVFDLGQNMAGSFRMRVHEPRGTKIHLQVGEVMQDDCFYRDNLRTAKAEYIYISDGNEHIIEPVFTFYGFRYVKVQGVTDLKEEDFTGYALYSELPYSNTLKTGVPLVNQLISNASWGMKSNYLDVPTDCPQRDERMGWTGDAMVFTPTALYTADAYAFMRKYLYDMEMEQKRNEGAVPFTIPSFHIRQTACVWGDATVIIPWQMYQFSGDLSILKEHYPAMKAWVDYIRRVDGDDHTWRKMFHFGDWLALDGPQGAEAVKGATDDAFVADVYYRHSALLTAKTAHLLGFEEDEKELIALAETIKKGIEEEFYTPNGRCAVMTQTAQILSIQEGLGSKEQAKKLLMRLLKEAGGKLQTGFVGTPLLCNTLSETGLDTAAYDLLLNEEYPGWLFEVLHGATTIWERWNSLDENGKITGIGMNSLNHYSYGAIVEWIWKYAAGLKAEEPGFRRVKIQPRIDWRLKNIEAKYESACGTYRIRWAVEDEDHIRFELDVPYGCEAEVALPYVNPEQNDLNHPLLQGYVKQGRYEIIYVTDRPMKDAVTLDTVIAKALQVPAVKEYLEALPLFKQTEFSMMSETLQQGLVMIGILDVSEHHRIEQKLFELQK